MQLLIDSIAHQMSHGFKQNRNLLKKFKSEGHALQEATELIQAILAECVERQLPIDDALAALHVATLRKSTLTDKDYVKIIDASRSESSSKIRQTRTDKHKSLLRKIEDTARSEKEELAESRREVNELKRSMREGKKNG